MITMKQIESKMAQTLTRAAGTRVTVDYVKAKPAYFFIEWEGRDEKVANTINNCFKGKCQDFDYDSEFNFSSCYVNI